MLSCEPIGTEMASMSRNLRRQDTQSELTLAASKIAKISKALEPPAKNAALLRNAANGFQKFSTASNKGSNRSHPSQQQRSSQNDSSQQSNKQFGGEGSGGGPVGGISHTHDAATASQFNCLAQEAALSRPNVTNSATAAEDQQNQIINDASGDNSQRSSNNFIGGGGTPQQFNHLQ